MAVWLLVAWYAFLAAFMVIGVIALYQCKSGDDEGGTEPLLPAQRFSV